MTFKELFNTIEDETKILINGNALNKFSITHFNDKVFIHDSSIIGTCNSCGAPVMYDPDEFSVSMVEGKCLSCGKYVSKIDYMVLDEEVIDDFNGYIEDVNNGDDEIVPLYQYCNDVYYDDPEYNDNIFLCLYAKKTFEILKPYCIDVKFKDDKETLEILGVI